MLQYPSLGVLLGVGLLGGVACKAAPESARDSGSGPSALEVGGADLGVGSAEDAAVSWTVACDQLAQAECAQESACSAFAFDGELGSMAACEERYGGQACVSRMSSAGSLVTPAMVQECAAALRIQTCAGRQAQAPAACAWQGALSDGSSCTYDQQCSSGRCDLAGGNWCGQCKPKGGLGDACPATQRNGCADGLVCADSQCGRTLPDSGACSLSVWVCTATVPDGGSCLTRLECAWGRACIDGLCAAEKKSGDPCQGGLDCTFEQDVACLALPDGSRRQCTPITRVEAGDACDEPRGLYCKGSATCKGTNGAAAPTGVCSAPASDGAPCGGSVDCMYPSLCLAGKCTTAAEGICR